MGRDLSPANSYVDVGTLSTVQNQSNLTLTMWLRRSATNQKVVFGSYDGGNQGLFGYLWSDGNLYLANYNGGTSYCFITCNDSEWHHIAQVIDGGETGNNRLRMYIDGVLKSPSYVGSMPASTSSDNLQFNLGRLGASATYGDDGDMAEFKVFQSSLSADQVLADYYSNSLYPKTNHWPLGWGSPEPDYAGGVDGTLTNSPTISDHPPIPMQFGKDAVLPYAVSGGGSSDGAGMYHHLRNLGVYS